MASRLEPELVEVYNAWKKNPSPDTNFALIKKISPWIQHSLIATGGDLSNKALATKANMMALEYLKRYDPNASTMKNFLYGQMRGLHRVIGNDTNIIRVPETIVLDRGVIDQAEKDFVEEHGRFPSTTELADKTGFSVKRITKLREVNVPLTEAGVNTAFGEQHSPSSNILGMNKANDAWTDYVYDSLGDRQKAVMERLYGLHGFKPASSLEVSKQLKISPAAVSRYKKEIDKALDSDDQYDVFGD